jgi:hypothetical protein
MNDASIPVDQSIFTRPPWGMDPDTVQPSPFFSLLPLLFSSFFLLCPNFHYPSYTKVLILLDSFFPHNGIQCAPPKTIHNTTYLSFYKIEMTYSLEKMTGKNSAGDKGDPLPWGISI